MKRLSALPLTPAWAILLAGALLAVAIALAPLVAPWRLVSAGGYDFWWFNAVTGETSYCGAQINPFDLACSWPRRPHQAAVQ